MKREMTVNKTAVEILGLLEQNKGKSLSGEKIASLIGTTRSAVWKNIKLLRESGYSIDAASNRGYELNENNDIFSALSVAAELEKIKGFNDIRVKFDIEVVEEISSTNAVLKESAKKGAKEGRVLIAKKQTAGKGRLGRSFFSPKNGLYLSLILRPELNFRESMFLTAIAAVAVVEAINEVTGKEAGIKWVNDVYMSGKKVCGILTEAEINVENGLLSYAVLGIGINLTEPEEGFPEDLKSIVACVYGKEEATKGSMNRLAAAIIGNYFKYYEKLPKHDFMESYKKHQILIDKDIYVISLNDKKKAHVLGVDDEARLIVEYEDGSGERISSGEVSVREVKDMKNAPKFNKPSAVSVILLFILAVTVLFGCGINTQGRAGTNKSAVTTFSETDDISSKDTFVFEVKSTNFVIGEDPTGKINALSEKHYEFEALSCALSGKDIIYSFSGFNLTVNKENEESPCRLVSILLTDDSVTTKEGLYIGMSESDMEKIYGEPDEDNLYGSYTYKKGDMELNILTEDGTVSSIEYRKTDV